VDQYGERAYRDGLDVTLTIQTATQAAAYDALHDGLLRAQQRRRYIPLGRVAIDGNAPASGLDDYPDRDGLTTAVVTATADRGGRLTVKTRDGTTLRAQAPAYAATPLTRGTVVTMASLGGKWEIAQAPDMEGALVSIDSVSGDVVAWVGAMTSIAASLITPCRRCASRAPASNPLSTPPLSKKATFREPWWTTVSGYWTRPSPVPGPGGPRTTAAATTASSRRARDLSAPRTW
jgi:hypothetical protein